MRYFIAAIIVTLVALIGQFKTAVHTPVMEEVNEFFGGVLSNNVAVDTTVETTNSATNISSPGIVWTSDTHGYIFYEDSTGQLSLSTTTNSGATWSAARRVDSVNTTDVVSFGVWWEGWTPGTTTTRYIHIVTTDLGIDDTYYTRLDTQTGAFTATVVGTTRAATCTDNSSCYASINMTATGTLMMAAADGSDSWTTSCFSYLGCSSTSAWKDQTNLFGSTPAGDHSHVLIPLAGTDNNLLVFHNTTGLLVFNIYSATTSLRWFGSLSSFASGIEYNTTYDSQFIGATLSTSTGLVYLVAVDDANDYITADHDVRVWSFSTTTWAWTAKTNCVQNYGGIIGAKIAWDEANDTLYCIYGARTTIGTATTGNIYFKTSTDGGTTWSATSSAINDNADDINGMTVNIIGDQRIGVTWNYTTAPRADQQYYDDIADLIADGGGGGGSTPSQANTVIWFD